MESAQKSNGLAAIASRRSHRKSRLGCGNCKRRRIKCDERKPSCTNCIRHSIRCDFTDTAAQSTASNSTSPIDRHTPFDQPLGGNTTPSGAGGVPSPFSEPSASPNAAQAPAGLNISDLELLHNYSTSTSYTISNVAALHPFWRVNVPRIGFRHQFVMHGLLALSAVHLAHFRPDQQGFYLSQADHHWEIALRTATSLLQNIDADNCHALYIFAIISTFFTLGKGPKPGDFLAFGDNRVAEWILLFRGIQSIFLTSEDVLMDGPLAPLFRMGHRRIERQYSSDLVTTEDDRLPELRKLVLETAANDPHFDVYMGVTDHLLKSFFDAQDPRKEAFSSQNVFVWLYGIPDDYVLCLQQHQPVALAIFAHFLVLMKQLETNWWMKGWINHLIAGIHNYLDEEYRLWIRWPLEQIGWIPA